MTQATQWLVVLWVLASVVGCGPSQEPVPSRSNPSENVAPQPVGEEPQSTESPADAPGPSHRPVSVPDGELSLLVVTLDTTRADRLAPYGADTVETPTLSRLAAEGVVFEQAVAVTPVTLPSHASLFTGLYPPSHGVRNNSIHYLDPSFTTLAETLQQEGFRTAAVVSAAVLDARFGLDQGFEVYEDDLSDGSPRELRLNLERPAERSVDHARGWLDGLDEGERFFLWVHFFDPHAPYQPPEPFASRYRERPYEGEIAALDAQIGRLLEHPRLDPDRTVVMVIADHGESLGEHGEDTHAMLLYEGTQHIPWIVRDPRGPGGLRVATPVSQVDLLPTAVELLGLETGGEGSLGEAGTGETRAIEGFSLAASVLGEAPRSRRETSQTTLYLETLVPFYTYGWAELYGARQGAWKYLDSPEPELYDLAKDRAESDNLATREERRSQQLHAEIDRFDAVERESAALPRDREMEARLRSLGYLTGGAGTQRRDRLDPKRVIDLHLAVERGQELFYHHQPDRAEAELRKVLARDRDNLQALSTLAKVRVLQGRLEDAAELARRAIELDPENPDLHVTLGQVESSRGDFDQALVAFETALALDPLWLDAAIERVRCLDRMGRRELAVTGLETILENDSDHGRSQVAWAELVELPAGQLAEAEQRLRRVAEREPRLVETWRVLGRVLEAGQQFEEALAAYRQGLDNRPGEGSLHARLGALLARLGQVEPARQSLQQAIAGGSGTASVYYGLASLAIRSGDWRKVEAHARRAVELDPSLSGAWNLLAASLEEQGDLAAARPAYDRAVAEDADNWRARLNRGLLAMRQERFAEAASDFEAVLVASPRHAGAHFQLGLLYGGHLGDGAKARQHLLASREADPQNPRVREIERLLTLLR